MNEKDVIPAEDFAKAIAECRKDPEMDKLFCNAPRGARSLIGLLFYAQVFNDAVNINAYHECQKEVESDLVQEDFDYLLGQDFDEDTIQYLRALAKTKACLKPSGLKRLKSVKEASSQLSNDDVDELPPVYSRTVDSRTEFERMAVCERRKKRIEMMLSMLKNIMLLSVVAAICIATWGIFSGKMRIPFLQSENTGLGDAEGAKSNAARGVNELRGITGVKGNGDEKGNKPSSVSFDECRDKLVIVGNEGMQSGGSGFLVRMGEKTYFVTNEHVTRGPRKWFEQVRLIDGREIKLGKFEVADGQDVVRFEVSETLSAFELVKETPKMNAPIAIYGNSAGGGAATALAGEIKAVGPYRLEVTAETVAGNSGSPVLDDQGRVIGVFTYATNEKDETDWGKKNTRFNDVRRWAVRFGALRWIETDWNAYREQAEKLSDVVSFLKRLLPFVAMEMGTYKTKQWAFPVHYDAQSGKIFSVEDSVFKKQLLDLSQMVEARQELESALEEKKNNGVSSEHGRIRLKLRKNTKSMSGAVQTALSMASKVLSETKWVAPQFRSDMTDFCPMQWYCDLIREMMNDQRRFVAELDKEDAQKGRKKGLFEQVKSCLVLVEAGESSGTGFIVKMDNRKYFITNEHVTSGGSPFCAKTTDGRSLKFKSFEIAENEDLVRMELADDACDALEMCTSDPVRNETIYVFGNSDGGGVMTHEQGRIEAIGPERLEVKANFVQGNSGSAVLNDSGEVLGVATYATLRNDPEDWVKIGTRYDKPRRFAVRTKNVKWKKMSWPDYVKRVKALEDCDRYVQLCRTVCFGGQKILRGYEVREKVQDGKISQESLIGALIDVGRADDMIVATLDMYKTLRGKVASTKKGSLDNPKDKLKRLVKNYPKILQRCSQSRLDVLRTGLRFIDGWDWRSRRLEERSKEYRRFFDFHIRRFKEFYKGDLAGPSRLTMPDDTGSL